MVLLHLPALDGPFACSGPLPPYLLFSLSFSPTPPPQWGTQCSWGQEGDGALPEYLTLSAWNRLANFHICPMARPSEMFLHIPYRERLPRATTLFHLPKCLLLLTVPPVGQTLLVCGMQVPHTFFTRAGLIPFLCRSPLSSNLRQRLHRQVKSRFTPKWRHMKLGEGR
jgi:hypothetical protein